MNLYSDPEISTYLAETQFLCILLVFTSLNFIQRYLLVSADDIYTFCVEFHTPTVGVTATLMD